MGENEPSFRQQLQQYLRPVDEWDKTITQSLVSNRSSKSSFYGNWKSFMIKSEISSHGLTWFSGCCVLLRFTESKAFQQFLINLFIALILDIVLVAVVKAVVRRPRPPHNQRTRRFSLPIHKYAFPSGRTTRAVFLAVIFYQKRIGGFFGSYLSIAWAFVICVSRILLGRNYVGDILAGMLLGSLEAKFFLFFWLSADTTQKVLRTFSVFQLLFGDSVSA